MGTITQTRKQVQINPNDQFSDIKVIRATTDKAAQGSHDLGGEYAKKVSEEVAAQTMESMRNVW